MCHDLAFQLETWKPDLIVGVVRGGVVPALHLSHELEKPMDVISWQTRDNTKQEHKNSIIESILSGARVAFVDDINDSGRTFQEIKKTYAVGDDPQVKFVSLVQKTCTALTSDHCSLILGNEKWIVYPWEKV